MGKYGKDLLQRYVNRGDHSQSDYLTLIAALANLQKERQEDVSSELAEAYELLFKEIQSCSTPPPNPISFGTSGWRGRLGKEVNRQTVLVVTRAIIKMYDELEPGSQLASLLGVADGAEARKKGAVVGHDNRFAGGYLVDEVSNLLSRAGFLVYHGGESTTGVLSAALLELNGAFSINLTPSHNPLEYGGYKFNAADAGPAAPEVTSVITQNARMLLGTEEPTHWSGNGSVEKIDSLKYWLDLVRKSSHIHGLDLDDILSRLAAADFCLIIDCVHGASRLHLERLLGPAAKKLTILRGQNDPTFGGVAPEPSSANLKQTVQQLQGADSRLRLGAIIDPDGDRIRFTDGSCEISMNQFGALAYYFLHEEKQKRGMVAKTVATSNFANAIATGLGEEVFEPAVGFKNFKPVLGEALVFFEESDGISIIGHTPEKDAYIGLLLAIEMMLKTGCNLGEYQAQVEKKFGAFFPERDGVTVSISGDKLLSLLAGLDKYGPGATVVVGDETKEIRQVITVDGHKIVFADDSWLMIRPSGTEPKVRFYVEARQAAGAAALVATAKKMLEELGLV